MAAVALAGVALVTALLLRPSTAQQSTQDDRPPAAATPTAPTATATATAASAPVAARALVDWSDAQLPAGTTVTVPDEVLPAVLAAGGDEQRYRASDVEGPDALRLVEGPPPEGSLVLATFADRDGAGLTLVDPRPGRPTADELARRQRLAAALLANPATGATGRAADVLERAHVDPRLLGVLAVLAARPGIGIADLPPAVDGPVPEDPADAPLVRSVLIDRMGDEPVGTGRPATDGLLAFLDAQLPPYAPDTVEVTDDGVRVAYRYESTPDALVSRSTP